MKVVAYARVSTERQEREGLSLQAQERLFDQASCERGYEIVRRFIEVESAYRPNARKVFTEMLSYLKEHREIQAVLCYKIDRLTRNITDAAELIERLGVRVISLSESFPENSAGDFMRDLHVSMAKYFSAQISERTRLGMLEKVRQGKYPSLAPIGYRNVHGEIVPDPECAPIVRQLFHTAATGHYSITDLHQLALQSGLRARGFAGRRGRLLSRAHIHRLLRNPLYAGLLPWRGQVYPGSHEPLVSHELFQRVQEALTERRNGTIANHHRFAYRGLLICGYCGTSITAGMAKRRYIYYRCTQFRGRCDLGYIRGEVLSDRLSSLIDQVEVPGWEINLIQRLIDHEIEKRRKESQKDAERLQAELERLEGQIDRALEKTLVSVDGVEENAKRVIAGLVERREAIKGQLMTPRETVWNRGRIQAFELLDVLLHLKDHYLRAGEFQRGAILRALLWNSKITRDSLEPNWKSPIKEWVNMDQAKGWEGRRDLNPQQSAPQADALPG